MLFKKNRAVVFALCVILTAVSAAGCGPEENVIYDTGRQIEEIPGEDGSTDVSGDDSEPAAENTVEEPETETGEQISEDAGIENTESDISVDDLHIYSDEEIAQASADSVGRYGYESLDKDLKDVYNCMYLSVTDMQDNVSINCFNRDDIQAVFRRMVMDHAELFWVSGYTFTDFKLGDEIQAVGFSGNYTCDETERQLRQQKIDSYAAACLAGAGDGDDYSRIKYVYEYLINNTEYDTSAEDSQNICSVFINGRSVCQGYARATQYLLDKLGVKCFTVSGTDNTGQAHAWNIVFSDGSWYQLDTTWGDSSYRDENSDSGVSSDINYDYLCVTDEEIYRTHTPDGSIQLPNCISMEDNYYVREGAYFTSVDTDRLASLFESAKAQGKAYVTVKASDSSAYEALKQYLVNDQHIFEYTGESGNSVSYWPDEDTHSIRFRL